jgi:hypothetical protein
MYLWRSRVVGFGLPLATVCWCREWESLRSIVQYLRVSIEIDILYAYDANQNETSSDLKLVKGSMPVPWK